MLVLEVIIGYIILCLILVFIYHIFDDNSANNFKAKHFENKMDVHYIGKVSDIKWNFDMWCTYVYYLQRKYNISPEDYIDVTFTMKEGFNRTKVCRKFWRENDKSPYNLDDFIDKYFTVDFTKK